VVGLSRLCKQCSSKPGWRRTLSAAGAVSEQQQPLLLLLLLSGGVVPLLQQGARGTSSS
jgi:hypothetical protein